MPRVRNLTERLRLLLFPLHRLPSDVAAAEAVRPPDPLDRPVGARLRVADCLAERRDVEDAPPVGEHAPAVRLGAGMEDLDAVDLRGLFASFDQLALLVGSR